MKVLGLGVVFGVGYLLGSKAGREKYDLALATAMIVAARPEVKKVTDPLIGFFLSGGGPGEAVIVEPAL